MCLCVRFMGRKELVCGGGEGSDDMMECGGWGGG